MKMAKFSRPLKVSVLCVLWYFMSSTNNVICKKILRNYPYPMTITLFHLTSISLFMYPVLMIANLPTKFHYSKHFFWKFIIPLGFGKMLGSAASYVSIWRVSVSYAHTIKVCVCIIRLLFNSCAMLINGQTYFKKSWGVKHRVIFKVCLAIFQHAWKGLPFKRQPHEKVKHTQTIRRQEPWTTNAPLIKKPINWFVMQIRWLVSIWEGHWAN